MHVSVPVESSVEFLNITSFSPLISHCEIKVCYVGDEPNRNGSVITKEVAKEMAPSLRGSVIAGFYNKEKKDFEEHNQIIDVSNGKWDIISTTVPYGFVDLNARVWFQKFIDDGVEHEYLMTEGYLWTEMYPESKRIIEKGNNQSMELHSDSLKGYWECDDKGNPVCFIINEALIQKLCILGEDVEPCFEGAGIAATFSFDENFKNSMFSLVKELQTTIQEGGVAQMDEENKVITEEQQEEQVEEITATVAEEETSTENVEFSEAENSEDKNVEETADEIQEDKKEYSLDEIPEYVELKNQFAALEEKYNNLVSETEALTKNFSALEEEIKPLREFKASAEKKEKQALIDSFYMLSNEDKKSVVENIDNYSLRDIEAELSIICVRNKVSFSLENDNKETTSDPAIYSLGDTDGDNAPDWIKSVRETKKNRNN